MRALVGCEFSGVVRRAFVERGIPAQSCDFLPAEDDGEHYQMDVLTVIRHCGPFDLGIFFPPCTYLCSSGMHWTTRGLRDPMLTEQALEFVRQLLDAPIRHIALENPRGCINTRVRKPDQRIQPYFFGEDASKETCLWLKGLPPLVPTGYVAPRIINGKERWAEQARSISRQVEGTEPNLRWRRPGNGQAVGRIRHQVISVNNKRKGKQMKAVQFGAIGKKETTTKKTEYPVAPDPTGSLGKLAANIIDHVAAMDALKGTLETEKKDIRCDVREFYFANSLGHMDVPSSVAVKATGGAEVLITFQNRYKQMTSNDGIIPILGQRTEKYFRQKFTVEIDGDKLPEDKAQQLLEEMAKLCARYGAQDSLSYSECYKPTVDFHARRHLELTVAENIAVDEVCPIVAMVKTKGRGCK